MHILENDSQASGTRDISANALLKFSRSYGQSCRMNMRATLRDVVSAVRERTVLVQCRGIADVRQSIYIVLKIEEGMVQLRDAQTSQEQFLSVAQFARAWHGDNPQRKGRMMTVAPRA